MQNNIHSICPQEIDGWKKQKKRYSNALLLIKSHSYYFSLEEDAKEISELPEPGISFNEKEEIVTIPDTILADTIIPKLIKRGFRIKVSELNNKKRLKKKDRKPE